MTERGIPPWAFKAASAVAMLTVLLVVGAFSIIISISQDLAVIKDRSENFEKAIEKINDYEVRITVLESSNNSRKKENKR